MILHVHKSITEKTDLKLIAKEFVSRTTERKSTLGNIKNKSTCTLRLLYFIILV